MPYHYGWLWWSSAFLVPWLALYVTNPRLRPVMWRVSFATAGFPQVWNLPALSGVLIGGIPLEELVFGFSFGWYWAGVYEHFTWSTSVGHADTRRRPFAQSPDAFAAPQAQAQHSSRRPS